MDANNIDKNFSQINELVELICDVRAKWASNSYSMCWFRGSNTTYDLMSGQYRSAYQKQKPYDEDSTFFAFRQKARGFLNRDVNNWELFFLMQHYRVPTRLLDWTLNAFVALYFALIDQTPNGDPCVWMFNPCLFNEWNTPSKESHIVVNPGSEDPKSSYVNTYHPLYFKDETSKKPKGKNPGNRNPIAMYPPTIDPRIIAQSSVFTLHGSRQDPIDRFCEGHRDKKTAFICKFVFKKGDRHEVLRELCCFGISRHTIFPDLEGLGLEFREEYFPLELS